MSQRKEKIHHVKHAVNADGTVDVHKMISHAQQALGQLQAGHYKLENPTQEEVEPGRVRITFERVETDKSVEAHENSVPA